MQTVQFPDDQFQKLITVAHAAGYDDVAAFFEAIAEGPVNDFANLPSEQELAESMKMIRESEADIVAGRTQNMREGLRQIAEKHGLTIER